MKDVGFLFNEIEEDEFLMDINEEIPIATDLFKNDEEACELILNENNIPEFEVEVIPRIPVLTFVGDDDIELVVNHDESKIPRYFYEDDNTQDPSSSSTPDIPAIDTNPTSSLLCEKCGKQYKRKHCYEKHFTICKVKKKTKKIPEVTEDNKTAVPLPADLEGKVDKIVNEALQSMISNKLYSLTKKTADCMELCKNVLEKVDIRPFLELLTKHFANLYTIASRKKNQVHLQEKMLSQYHNICIDTVLIESWESLVSKFVKNPSDTNVPDIVFQSLTDKLFTVILKYINKQNPVHDFQEDVTKMDRNELQTIRYVSGYIIFSIKKSIKDPKSGEAKAVLTILNTWGTKNDLNDGTYSLSDYTTEWIAKVNRGGLLKVHDNFFNFICLLESAARNILNTTFLAAYCGENIYTKMFQIFSESESINMAWEGLVVSFGNRVISDKLKVKILNKWINIRLYAFVNVWVQICKRKNAASISEKGERSMRKSLPSSKRK